MTEELSKSSEYRCETCCKAGSVDCPMESEIIILGGFANQRNSMYDITAKIGCLSHSAIAARQHIILTPECPDCKDNPAWKPDWLCKNTRPDIYQSCINNRKEGKCPRNIPLFYEAAYQQEPEEIRYLITKDRLDVFEECLKFIVGIGQYKGCNILTLDECTCGIEEIRNSPLSVITQAAREDERKRVIAAFIEKGYTRIETVAPLEGIHLGWVLLSDVKSCLESLRAATPATGNRTEPEKGGE